MVPMAPSSTRIRCPRSSRRRASPLLTRRPSQRREPGSLARGRSLGALAPGLRRRSSHRLSHRGPTEEPPSQPANGSTGEAASLLREAPIGATLSHVGLYDRRGDVGTGSAPRKDPPPIMGRAGPEALWGHPVRRGGWDAWPASPRPAPPDLGPDRALAGTAGRIPGLGGAALRRPSPDAPQLQRRAGADR